MDRRDAVLDASFWINAERSGLTGYLLDYFWLHVPPIVAEELTVLIGRVPGPLPAATLFAEWQSRGDVELVKPEVRFERFDAGENQAIALAQERDWMLLIDDEAPRHYSRGPLGLRVVDSAAFTFFLYDQGRLAYREALAALRRSHAARRLVGEALVAVELLARRKGEH